MNFAETDVHHLCRAFNHHLLAIVCADELKVFRRHEKHNNADYVRLLLYHLYVVTSERK